MSITTRRRRAFTLIELFTGILILSILGALLFPVFNRTRENARRSNCQSNFQKIGIAMMQYQRDNDDRTLVVDENLVPQYTWFHPIQPYVKSLHTLRCLSLTEIARETNASPEADYSINGFFTHSLPMSTFSNAAQQISMGERLKDCPETDYHTWSSAGFESRLERERHLAGSTYLFADGHVKWMKWSMTLQPAVTDPTSGLPVGMHNRDALPKPPAGAGP